MEAQAWQPRSKDIANFKQSVKNYQATRIATITIAAAHQTSKPPEALLYPLIQVIR